MGVRSKRLEGCENGVMSQGMWVASGSQGNKFSIEVSRENAANTLIIGFWPLEL